MFMIIQTLASQIFTKDEQGEIVTELAPIMKKNINWFLEHVVISLPPIGETFRFCSLKFHALVSGCTIDWYPPWPKETFVSVASHFIKCSPEAKKRFVQNHGICPGFRGSSL